MELLVDTSFSASEGVLSEEESRHCISVMRHRVGDEVNVSNGQGILFRCTIEKANSKECLLNVVEQIEQPRPAHHLHMAVAPTKNIDRFEWFVEKAVEMGVGEITPIICQHSERTHLRLDRLYRLVVAACKQSLKFYLPQINEPCTATDLISNATEEQRYILHCVHNAPKEHLFNMVSKGMSSLVLIGPEGDFSQQEIEQARLHNFAEPTLGDERLRTETAAMMACHVVNLKNKL